MGSSRVGDYFPKEKEGDSSPSLSYHEIIDNLCPDYLAMGMSWDDYWFGDPWMAKAVRQAHRMKQNQRNFDLWLQGAYVYEAILDASPVFHPFAKEPKPVPYPSQPYPLNADDRAERKKKEEEEQDKHNQEVVKAWIERVNRIKAEKEGKKGVQPDGGR